MQEYVASSSHISNSILSTIKVIDDLSLLTDTICCFIPLSFHKRLEYVEELNAMYRAKSLLKDIKVELEVLKLDKKIEHELENSLEQSQKEFILREKVKILEHELGDNKNEIATTYLEELESLNLPKSIYNKLTREIKKLEYTNDLSPEQAMIRNYLEWVLHLPWHKTTFENNNLEDIKRK